MVEQCTRFFYRLQEDATEMVLKPFMCVCQITTVIFVQNKKNVT